MKYFSVFIFILFVAVSCKPKSPNQKIYRDKFKDIDSVQVSCFRSKDTLNFTFNSGRDLVIFKNIVGRDRDNVELKSPFKNVVFYQGGKVIFSAKIGIGGMEYNGDDGQLKQSRVGASARQYLDQVCEGIPKN